MFREHQSGRKLHNYLCGMRSALSWGCAPKISKSRTTKNFTIPSGENRDYQLVRRYPKGFCATFSGSRDKFVFVKKSRCGILTKLFCCEKQMFPGRLAASKRLYESFIDSSKHNFRRILCCCYSFCAQEFLSPRYPCFSSNFFKRELNRKVLERASDHCGSGSRR